MAVLCEMPGCKPNFTICVDGREMADEEVGK